MTDLPNSEADAATPPAPDGQPSTADPELAALVRREATPPTVDTELAALVKPAAATSSSDAPTVAAATPVIEPVPVVTAPAAAPAAAAVGPQRHGRSLVLRFGVAFVLGLLLAVGVGAGALYAWGQQYEGRILPGVRVGSTDVGGLTPEQAQAEIAKAYASLGSGQITLNGPEGHVTTISYADIGRGPDTAALLDAALAAGRRGEPFADLIGAPQAALHGVTLDSAVAYDRDKLAAAIATIAAAVDQEPVDATISGGESGAFDVTPSKDGRAVDEAGLLTALDQQLASLDAPAAITMTIPVASLPPAVPTASAEAAQAAAQRMTADVVITRGKETWTIPGTSLAPLVSFSTAADGTITPAFDAAGLDPMVAALAKKINQTARDAGLKLSGGHIIATGSSREGRTLIADGMKTAIVDEITARQGGAAATPLAAVVEAVDPKLTTADAKAYAAKMRPISSFSVYYWVIINNHFGGNIEAPATKINGTVIPAGGKFDFWKVVGDLRKLPGAGPGNAIEGGKITVTGAFGGGICTTSTTLFNAAFRAGMIPLARQNHNEFIDRYPPGLDATVWIVGNAKQTMSFKNDTKYPILIQRIITHAGNKRWITFKIWSLPNGRTYKVSNVVIKRGPHAKDTIVKDPTKPVGYRFRNNAPADGAKVWVTVSIFDHGKLHWRKRYYSNYPAVDGVLIVGTKGGSKTPAPTPTPSPTP